MKAYFELSIRFDTNDSELEKKLVNSLDGEIEWDDLLYLLEFTDNISYSTKHRRHKDEGKRHSKRSTQHTLSTQGRL